MEINWSTLESLARPRNLFLITLVAFVVALMILIPREDLARAASKWVSQSVGAKVQMQEVGWAFPIGLDATGLSLAQDDLSKPILTCKETSVKPAWGQLIQLAPALYFQCETEKGGVEGTYSLQGDLEVTLNRLNLELPMQGGLPGSIQLQGASGRLSGQQKNTIWRPLKADLTSQALVVKSPWFTGPTPLELTQVALQGEGDLKQFTVRQISAAGMLSAKGKGRIRWRDRAMAGRWDAEIILTPGPELPTRLEQLLQVGTNPQPDGSYLLRSRSPFRL